LLRRKQEDELAVKVCALTGQLCLVQLPDLIAQIIQEWWLEDSPFSTRFLDRSCRPIEGVFSSHEACVHPGKEKCRRHILWVKGKIRFETDALYMSPGIFVLACNTFADACRVRSGALCLKLRRER
jgi:hypothetical protein